MSEQPRHAAGGVGGEQLTGAALVGVAVLSIQLGSALATTLFDEIGPAGAVLLRIGFAAALLLALWRPSRATLRGRPAADIAAFGVILAGMNFAFFLAIDRIPLGIAVTLEFTGPLAVAIAASRRPLDLLWVALAGAGVLLLAPGIGDGLDGAGVLFALIAGAFWGAYLIVSARVGRGPAGRSGLGPAMLVATLLLLPAGVVEGGSQLLEPEVLGVGAALALVGSAIPFTCELEALRRLAAGTVGILLSVEPAVAALVGLIALDQGLLAREVVAIGCVICASAGALSTAPTVETTQA